MMSEAEKRILAKVKAMECKPESCDCIAHYHPVDVCPECGQQGHDWKPCDHCGSMRDFVMKLKHVHTGRIKEFGEK